MITRGIKHDVDRYISDLQAQYFPFPNIQGPGTSGFVQLGIRPVQLWEVVFPKESKEEVIKTLSTGPPVDDWRKKYFDLLRISMGLTKLPEVDLTGPMRILYKNNVAAYLLGTKEDKSFEGPEYL